MVKIAFNNNDSLTKWCKMARMIQNYLIDLKITSKWPQNDIEVPDTFVDITIDRIFRILPIISHRTDTL